MSEIKDGGPAFPTDGECQVGPNRWHFEGMTLRDWFAGNCLAGMHARISFDEGLATPKQRAHIAFIDADAMLAEREKSK